MTTFKPIGEAAASVVSRLQAWDEQVAPCLHAIQDNSRWISKHAERIDIAAKALLSKPAFETQAVSDLAIAEMQLGIALRSVQDAMQRYHNLEQVA